MPLQSIVPFPIPSPHYKTEIEYCAEDIHSSNTDFLLQSDPLFEDPAWAKLNQNVSSLPHGQQLVKRVTKNVIGNHENGAINVNNLEKVFDCKATETFKSPAFIPAPTYGQEVQEERSDAPGELAGVFSPCHLYTPEMLSDVVGLRSYDNFAAEIDRSSSDFLVITEERQKDSSIRKSTASSVHTPYALSSEDRVKYLVTHPAYRDPLINSIASILHDLSFNKVIQKVESSSLYEVVSSPFDESIFGSDKENTQHIKGALNFINGLAHYKQKNYSAAKVNFTSCQNRSMSLCAAGKADIGLCHVYLGDCEFEVQHYEKAAMHYGEAIRLYSYQNVAILFGMIPPSISVIHAKHGSALSHIEKMMDAMVQYKLAIEKAVTDKNKLSAISSLGKLYLSLGENSSALAHFEKSIILSEKLQDFVSLGRTYGDIGNAYLGLLQKDKAFHYLAQSHDLTVEYEPTPQAISRTYNNLGTAYQSLGDLDKAQEHYDHALSQAIYGNDTASQACVYGNIGNAFLFRKMYKEAIPHYAEVLKLSKDRSTLSTAHHNRGCAYYEWAETNMEALSTAEGQQCYFHGPGFENDPHPVVTPEIASYYRQGSNDLQEVVCYHEENLDNVKCPPTGLNLSISLFETNSHTFHCLQDCLVSLGEYTQALLVAEQSRARTLGELMLKRKGWSLPHPLSSPLQFEQVMATVANRNHPVLYLSYTGARLLGWVFMPQDGDIKMNMFEVPLKDGQFDGKSFDYHLRYNLTEALVEKTFEMYKAIEYDADSSKSVQYLYALIAKPLIKILEKHTSVLGIEKLTIIADSYTALVPFSSLLHTSRGFLGDESRFQMMPSLLTMSILDQLPNANVVCHPSDGSNMCIAGNPIVPQFAHNGEVWNLGKLPHAKWEAEWVAHIIKTTPILEEQATKSAILMQIQSAKVIHLATHGSASAGFMAFGAMASLDHDSVVDADSVLLYREDVEQLNISPALVVLSTCDSGQGTVKADGIQNMARAFVLAGAQAVLTTLWRAPDESASIFMQFFYQYMMDGLESTRALQKAILSIRCFSKYSQYIHWSGYQLTGRDVHFECSTPYTDGVLKQRLGPRTVFPHLPIIKDVESALVKDPCYSTDVQILQGCPGVKSSEVVVDFIYACHHHFRGGVFWINCRCQEFVSAAIDNIEKVLHTSLKDLELSDIRPVLLVLDGLTTLPGTDQGDDPSKLLLKLMNSPRVHTIVLYTHDQPPDKLIRAVDQKLLRGCKTHTIESLTMIQSTQRTVYTLQREIDLAPNNSDQQILEKLAEFTAGSPILVDITSQLTLSWLKKDLRLSDTSSCDTRHPGSTTSDFHIKLKELSMSLGLGLTRQAREPQKRYTSLAFKDKIPSVSGLSEGQRDEWDTRCIYDSWESTRDIINSFQLCNEENILLHCLSIFGCCPIPVCLVDVLSVKICWSSGQPHLTPSLLRNLVNKGFILTYPLPVVFHHSLEPNSVGEEFVYMPQCVASYVWKSLKDRDRAAALTTTQRTLSSLFSINHSCCSKLLGVVKLFKDAMELHSDLMDQDCFMEMHRLHLKAFYLS